jgi:hypothetical protein
MQFWILWASAAPEWHLSPVNTWPHAAACCPPLLTTATKCDAWCSPRSAPPQHGRFAAKADFSEVHQAAQAFKDYKAQRAKLPYKTTVTGQSYYETNMGYMG